MAVDVEHQDCIVLNSLNERLIPFRRYARTRMPGKAGLTHRVTGTNSNRALRLDSRSTLLIVLLAAHERDLIPLRPPQPHPCPAKCRIGGICRKFDFSKCFLRAGERRHRALPSSLVGLRVSQQCVHGLFLQRGGVISLWTKNRSAPTPWHGSGCASCVRRAPTRSAVGVLASAR
jgi:hypothetical protein